MAEFVGQPPCLDLTEGASYAAQRVAELSAWVSERMAAQNKMANTD
jgi:hypothetical protein